MSDARRLSLLTYEEYLLLFVFPVMENAHNDIVLPARVTKEQILIVESATPRYSAKLKSELNFEKAAAEYEKIIDIGRDNCTALKETLSMETGTHPSFISKGFEVLDKHFANYPISVYDVASLKKAICLLQTDDTQKEAVAILRQMAEDFGQKETHKADTKIRKEIPRDVSFVRPDEAAVLLLAIHEASAGNHDAAISLCNRLLQDVPNSSVGFYAADVLAIIYKKLDQLEDAKRVLEARASRIREEWPVFLGGKSSPFNAPDKEGFIERISRISAGKQDNGNQGSEQVGETAKSQATWLVPIGVMLLAVAFVLVIALRARKRRA